MGKAVMVIPYQRQNKALVALINTYYSRERWRDRRDHWANEERQAVQTGNDEYAVLCRRMKNMYADRLKRAVK